MVNKINFPGLEKNVQLCFVRKYRQAKKTRYIFYKANIGRNVSKVFKEWLLSNISKIENINLKDYSLNNYKDLEYIDLNKIETWGNFEKKAFSLASQEEEILKEIRKNLIAFIIYIKQGKEIIGQIRKISSMSLLEKKGLFSLFLNDSSFNEIKEPKGIQIEKNADLIFKISKEKSEGIIMNKFQFNSVFDIIAQQKKESLNILKSNDFFNKSREKKEIEEIVKNDRTIQTMLLNPLVTDHMRDINFEVLKSLKKEVGERLAFKIDEDKGEIIFPKDGKNQAIKDFIKAISYRFSKSLDNLHILEEDPIRIIK